VSSAAADVPHGGDVRQVVRPRVRDDDVPATALTPDFVAGVHERGDAAAFLLVPHARAIVLEERLPHAGIHLCEDLTTVAAEGAS